MQSENQNKTIIIYWAAVNISLLFIFVNIAFSAWTISILWSWFLVPIFGLPNLNIFAVIGIKSMLALLRDNWQHNQKAKKDSDWLEGFFFVLGVNFMSLGIGWLAHFYV